MDDNELIVRNTCLVVARVPLPADQTPSWVQADAPVINSRDEANLGKSVQRSTKDCDDSKNGFLSVEELTSMFSRMQISVCNQKDERTRQLGKHCSRLSKRLHSRSRPYRH